MQDDRDHDDRTNALAVAIMARATYCQLADDADEFAALVKAVQQPIPDLPDDAAERASLLLLMLLQSRDQSRRLLALLT